MNRQKLFDQVLDAILDQGCASSDDSQCLLITGDEQRRCALGHLLPKSLCKKFADHADPVSENKIQDYLKVKMPKDIKFLKDLQEAHDDAETSACHEMYKQQGIKVEELQDDNKYRAVFMDNFIENMKDVAVGYKLDFVIP